MSQTKIILLRESVLASVTKDAVTFGSLVGSFWANHRFIGSITLDVVMGICFFVAVSSKAKRSELTPAEAIEELQQAPTPGDQP